MTQPTFTDRVPRYAPSHVMIASVMRTLPVTGWRFHPAGNHPANCPISPEYGVLECQTAAGSRFYGCERAYINSELRMVVIGQDARDEVRMRWPAVPADCV